MTHLSMKVAGIDTGKDELVVCFLPQGVKFKTSNTQQGIAELVGQCRNEGIVRAVIEATSIYHQACARALSEAGVAVIVAQPRQVRGFAQALLKWSKTDAIDAEVLASFGQIAREVRPLAEARFEKLAELLTYIELDLSPINSASCSHSG
jgi:transposase